jgi:hypothetical protein
MRTSPVKPGDRRKVMILGRAEAVHVLDVARRHPRHWLCKSEIRNEVFAVADDELEELMPCESTASNAS